VLERKTGKPLFPVKYRKVPASTVDGEMLSLVQPYPVKPPPFTRQAFTEDMITTRTPEAHAAVHSMGSQLELVESPLHRIEHALHPWVGFAIMPIFAFANSGVRIWGNVTSAAKNPISLGIVLGLFIGKPLGIWLFARLSVKSGVAAAPAELSWKAVFGAAWLCGIGFTMSLFIANLAFGEGVFLDMSKIGILAASLASGACASIYLLRTIAPRAV